MCVRLMGIVSTRWATPKDAGSAAATWRKKDRIAAKRALRVVTELFRFSSSSVEKSENEISISSSSANAPGFFRNRAAAKRISMRKASR